MFLSIVIPTCRRHASLQACLRQLDPGVQQVSDYEILVSDDATDDSLCSVLAAEFPQVRWAAGPRRGPAANRNAGAARASGDWLLFLDDDCLPTATLLSTYRAAMAADPACRVLEGSIGADRPMRRMDEESPINDTGGCLWSCNFAMQRPLFQELGGFCEAFPYAALEDVDLRERLKEKGEGFTFVPQAEVIHSWRPMALTLRHAQIQILSHRIFYGRHPRLRPTFVGSALGLARFAYRQLFIEGRPVRYRGLGRWGLRLLQTAFLEFYFVFMRALPPGKNTVKD